MTSVKIVFNKNDNDLMKKGQELILLEDIKVSDEKSKELAKQSSINLKNISTQLGKLRLERTAPLRTEVARINKAVTKITDKLEFRSKRLINDCFKFEQEQVRIIKERKAKDLLGKVDALLKDKPVEEVKKQEERTEIRTQKRWKVDLVDLSKVPKEYLMVDSMKVNQAIKAGKTEIAGLKIFVEEVPVRG